MHIIIFLLYFLKLWIAPLVTQEAIVRTDVHFHALDTGVSKCAHVPENNAIQPQVANLNK